MQWCDRWCFQHHRMLMPAPVASHEQRSHIVPYFVLSWLKKWMLQLTMPFGIRWHWCQWHHMMKKVILHLISIVLTWEMWWFHWWCHQYHVMLTLAPMASYNQESLVAPHFNCLALWNTMVPLLMLLVLCGPESVMSHDQKRHVTYHFHCLYLRKSMMLFMMLLVSCDTDMDPSGTIGIIWCQCQWQLCHMT